MQRRAAAAYVTFFLVIAAGSYGVIATTEAPAVTVQPGEAEHTLQSGTTFTVDGREYTVASISAEESDGTVEGTATLEWVNVSERLTASWADNSTITDGNRTYRVLIPNVSAPEAFQLRPEPGDATNPHWQNGSQFVDVDIDGDGLTERDVPIGRYLQANESLSNRTIEREGTLQYRGNETRIISLTNESATLEWTADVTHTVELAHRANATLGDRTFLAFFPSTDTIYLDSVETTRYFDRAEDEDFYRLRTNGFWAVSILSGFAIVLLVGLAYMPRRR
jgi:hypothetical protein